MFIFFAFFRHLPSSPSGTAGLLCTKVLGKLATQATSWFVTQPPCPGKSKPGLECRDEAWKLSAVRLGSQDVRLRAYWGAGVCML